MVATLLVIDPKAETYAARIRELFPEVTVRAVAGRSAAGEEVADVVAMMALGPVFEDGVIRRASRLEWLQFLSSGSDALKNLPSLPGHVHVTSSHGVHGAPVSEMALTQMLVLARDFRAILDNQRRAIWQKRRQPLLNGKTVAIVGTGLIGRALAERCKALGMTVLGVTATPRDIPFFDRTVPRASLGDVAAGADFLVLLTALTHETRRIVDAAVLARMKRTAILINLARGDVVDQDALLAALQEGRLAGAGLDVFAVEPLPGDHPFWHMDQVIVTPHMAGENDLYPDLVMPIVAHNLRAFLDGRPEAMRNRVARG